jgi:hypothetical protein
VCLLRLYCQAGTGKPGSHPLPLPARFEDKRSFFEHVAAGKERVAGRAVPVEEVDVEYRRWKDFYRRNYMQTFGY